MSSSTLIRYTGAGRQSVRTVDGRDIYLRNGETARVARLTERMQQAGLREVGAELARSEVTSDVLERELAAAQASLRELGERLDEAGAELRATIAERDAMRVYIERCEARIAELGKALEARDERIERMQALLRDAEPVDKPWLDATNAKLTALIAELGGELPGQPRKNDLLAWLYTQRQPAVATAWASIEAVD